MMTGFKKFGQNFLELDSYLTRKFVEHASQLCYWPQLFMVLVFFGITWVLTWNAHNVFPWIESLFNLGPYDPDTPGTILLRRTWSTAVCGPVIIYAVIRFSINRYRMNKDAEKKKQSIESN
jgi:hypothetical protein